MKPDCTISIVKVGGNYVTLDFASGGTSSGQTTKTWSSTTTTFHASWLWSNDPKNRILPSGQVDTAASWCAANPKPSIDDAAIVYCNIDPSDDIVEKNGHDESIRVPGPTVEDSHHPLPIYGDYPAWVSATVVEKSAGDGGPRDEVTCRPYLRIAWSDAAGSTNPQTADDSDRQMTMLTSTYDVEWLERFRYDDASRLERRERTEVRPIHAVRRNEPPLWYSTPKAAAEGRKFHPREGEELLKRGSDGLMHIDYSAIIAENDGRTVQREGLFQLCHAVFRDGAAIVSNAPTHNDGNQLAEYITSEDELPVSRIGCALSGGELSHGALYGNIFNVRVGEDKANNAAYTSLPLCPHVDMAYYESPPGMQLLHCIHLGDGVVGGESILIDGMAAAHRLRELRPASFETLVRCPATFIKQRDGACMTYRRPHIVLADDGGMGADMKDREIVGINWSPPFEGPVCLPPEQVDRYYEAYADFELILNDQSTYGSGDNCDELSRYAREFTWEHKLKPGDMLVFNNRRMLHGRRGFSSAEGRSGEDSLRHLVGCYANIDDVLNSYRVLLREKGNADATILNVGNGTNI